MTTIADQPSTTTKLLFVDAAAERLGRTPSQLRWMIHSGTAPKHAKIAGRIVFRQSDIDQYIEDAFAEAG